MIVHFCLLDHPIMMGFEPLVNQRLLPPTFPRYAKIIKREDMVNYFAKLIERIKMVCEVVNLTNLHNILVSARFLLCSDNCDLFFIYLVIVVHRLHNNIVIIDWIHSQC